MSDDLLLQGLATRRKLTSQHDVDEAFGDPSLCVQSFEEFTTEQYWGGCWSDETLSHRERSWLNLGLAAATGRQRDFALALQTALRSGITESELRAATKQIVLWCGIAIGSDCVQTAREVLKGLQEPTADPTAGRRQQHLQKAMPFSGVKVFSADRARRESSDTSPARESADFG
jgi:4-carboxymuconolactone decarboxylase